MLKDGDLIETEAKVAKKAPAKKNKKKQEAE
jgi:hypothetical protein